MTFRREPGEDVVASENDPHRRKPMRLKIFSCHHVRPEFTCNTEIFQTLVSNVPAPDDGSFMSDIGGVNIAGDNLYSELRHQYFVWKNLIDDYDYIGFEHYRRPFFIDTLPSRQVGVSFPAVWEIRLFFAGFKDVGLRRGPAIFEQYLAMRRSLDGTAIMALKQWIGGYDIVIPRPNHENIEQQWKNCFSDNIFWDTMIEGVNQSQIFKTRPNHLFFQMETCYFANMYIMRRDLLDEYLTFCFEVLDFCRSRLDLQGRALGYFSERLFTFWLYQKRVELPTLRVLELPFVMLNPAPGSGVSFETATSVT
jgi:Domain of unknown function (DUF4422)